MSHHAPGRPDDAAVAALDDQPHRRQNALTGEWVLVSAGRTKRPWLGAEEPEPPEERPEFEEIDAAVEQFILG